MQLHKRILTFLGLFEYHTDSKLAKNIHRIFLFVARVFFLYLGCTLQFLALLEHQSIEEMSVIISVGSVYLNIAVKDFVFALKRNDIEKLWMRFEDDDFKANEPNEFK